MLKVLVDIISVPAFLLGVIALIGLLLQKKDFSDVIKGTIKTVIGFIVLGGGAGMIVASLEPFSAMFTHAFNVQGIVPNNEAIVALAMAKYATSTSLIMVFGMIANIVIARFTPLKYIFLTGHHIFYMAVMIAVILAVSGLNGVALVAVGSIVLGFIMAGMPALGQKYMRKITGSNDISIGHFSTFGYILSGFIGQLVGKGSKSTEELTLPKSLNFIRDNSIAIALTMIIFYVILAVAAGSSFVESTLSAGQNFIIFSIIKGITFAAGVFIILQGVRMLLSEIIPAFKGISEKLVPNSKPALDCPVVFTYAPNATLIGFFGSFMGGLVGLFILGQINWVLILPGVVSHFFTGATAGVFGNATGGRRGALIGSFVNGLLITFTPILLLPVLGELGLANTTFSDADFGILGTILGYVVSIFK